MSKWLEKKIFDFEIKNKQFLSAFMDLTKNR